jgi:hypothetical protein
MLQSNIHWPVPPGLDDASVLIFAAHNVTLGNQWWATLGMGMCAALARTILTDVGAVLLPTFGLRNVQGFDLSFSLWAT